MSIIHLANQYSVSAKNLGIPTDNGTISQGLGGIIQLLTIVVGMGAVVMVIVGGLQLTLSAGNAAKVKQGRETVIYSLVGVALAAMAYVIVTYLAGQLK